MRTPTSLAPVAGAATLILQIGGLAAQDHEHDRVLGEVDFPTSCAAPAQAEFELGVAMLHSFWFPEARQAFERAAAADGSCAMAHWGLALTRLGNPMTRVSPAPDALADALAHARHALELAARATPRELGYARAVLALYEGYETVGHVARMARYEERMKELLESSPADDEAATFYALAVVANAPPTDMAFERQLVGAGILIPLFEKRPEHPGLAHYIIHAFDAPPIAERGLGAATRYADIAPSAPHALHMPSHIFTRLGYWDESAATNERAAQAETNPRGRYHPWDYMVYARLQQGKDRSAREVVDEALRIERDAQARSPEGYDPATVAYNLVAMPSRYALERNAWDEAARLEPFVGAAPNVEAITRFARGVGMARTGDGASALIEANRLEELARALRGGGDEYWATVVGAQALAVRAWAARASGQAQQARALALEAAELEETVEKHPVTPGPILPARELYADLLLADGQAAEALSHFQATLRREPNRARAVAGAASAAEAAGLTEEAAMHYRRLAELMRAGDGERPEYQRARAFLEAR